AAAEPYLTIRADGTAVFGNPRGDSRRVEARLSAQELQDLLRHAVRTNDFFGCDSRQLDEALHREMTRKGERTAVADAPLVALRIQADGRDHEVRCRGLNESLPRQFPEVKELGRLWAVRQRLERVV